ncbi:MULTISPECIES: MBL fold metallo-hydrolase [unclassified Breznakia]|uniref:MBL fold metallo-hydrolase n=1 Tax=unclassified Breznakia TaxID=2623764 RepID=UPI0024754EED|nr:MULTISPECIES: MBL fold metallo-hydrolase [unclassified Breznakia]MDH6366778.1 competence protein ComEC [Breznakia sp. PH1-1]MDH6403835.1 competence protein ComEC [Breznakia sp. PF1-11]MDH6411544.1 competence protein ComEC [Breznakia sp. PFB1-11]MDH6413908.1 competence protein ComEC [Breznakia sp. PFB1-14]MDH6416337.1 competence protein ComEC [Breznakia sp. PFB1-4]
MQYIGYIWISAILLIINREPKTNLLIIILSIGYLTYKTRRFMLFWFVVLCAFNTLLIKEVPEIPAHTIIEVIDVKEGYVVGRSDKQKVYIYNIDNVSFHDVIHFEGSYEKIHSYQNLHTFSFMQYANQEGAYYQAYANDFTVLAKSNSLKANMYTWISRQDSPAKVYFLNTLYNQKQEMMEMTFLSGFHIYLLVSLLTKHTKFHKWPTILVYSSVALVLFPLRFYMLSLCVRAAIECLFPKLEKAYKIHAWAFMLLCYDPNYLYHLGYVISISLATISIFNVEKRSRLCLTCLVLIPIHLYFFHEVNIFAILWFSWIQYLNTLMFIVSLIGLVIPQIFVFVDYILQIQVFLTSLKIEQLTIYGFPHVLWLITWIYLVLCMISYRKKKYVIYLAILLIIQHQIQFILPYGEVMFIDVGQGDTILIREPFYGKTMLIDVAGHIKRDIANEVIYPVLKSKGIRKIDVVAISHDDYDHSGGLDTLKKLIPIDTVVRSGNIQLDQLHFTNLNEQPTSLDENEKSMVLFAHIYGFNYLFTGDAGLEVEDKIIQRYRQLDIDILKVSHHGSNSGTGSNFLSVIQPHLAIISSGYNNTYNHPHDEVIENLKKQRSHIFNTQTHGSIHFYFIKNFQLVGTATQEFGIITKE